MAPDKTIADHVLGLVATHTGATRKDIRGTARLDYHVACRHMWLSLLRYGLDWTYSRIRCATGRRCHTVVIYACESFESREKEWQDVYLTILAVVQGWNASACDNEEVRQCLTDLSVLHRQLNRNDLVAIRQIIDAKKPDPVGQAA